MSEPQTHFRTDEGAVAQILDCDIAIVGAGPAGLAAGEAAAGTGARVILLDTFAAPGGQYSMQPTQGDSPFTDTPAVRLAREATARLAARGVQILTRAEVFHAAKRQDGSFRLAVSQQGAARVIRAGAVIAATGAMERPLPFPGWTLPGVIGAGAAQRLLKTGTGSLGPQGKTVLAGSGPFLFAVAQTFAKAGAPLDHLVEMRRPGVREALGLFLAHPSRLPEALRLMADLKASRARRHSGHMVTRALGTTCLEAVEIAPLGPDGQPGMAAARVLDGVGTLAIGYGFQPVVDLTTQLGADHGHDPALGGFYCQTGADGGTSLAGLYAAGETCGLGGANPARLSGRIAGLSAARGLGFAAAPDETAIKALRRARDFAARLAALWPAPQRLPLSLPPDELICRCEDVRVTDIRAAIQDGAREAMAVKLWTRAGMGPCQGRICGAGLSAVLEEAGVTAIAAGYNRAHLPLRPTPIGIVRAAMASGEWDI
ncbi:NAD(P)/FAD-dependent oxidoreductase [Paracoccus sp. IB05]|uniref:FAD/NAD(P)-dependent oxidoreductase n=1 Tax=Paracoccus sp. IB05 TaxID=2779367 RepID=UPI0018E8A0FC|nr:NAD(P)/FAD-dependent oxidoreductase [Paracoccus sp. IB05]MBJ2150201.1 FAD-dependent oxidoreductase [Paracoccus sp. IB05]